MTRKELIASLKQSKEQGLTSISLKASTDVLKNEYIRVNNINPVFDVTKLSIDWFVDRFHIGTSDMTIAKELLRRSKKFSKEQRREIVKYGINAHRENQKVYRAVMTGNFA